jgi:protein-L-isoaspartate(D-aspartate) O-methyltransferase
VSTNLDVVRRFYARLITTHAGVDDPRIIDAFSSVQRERFLGPGPWQIKVAADGYMASETADPTVLYQDIIVGLVPEKGINNGEPSLHAKSIGAAAPNVGDVVIHVGAGTGYYTAILAHLVGDRGRVYAYEIDADLAHRAITNLAMLGTVTVRPTSALEQPLPTADVIYVSAGATHVPVRWLDALRLGGRLVLPLTPTDRLGFMLLVTRSSDTVYGARVFSPAGFIPCAGARDEKQSRALADALDTRNTSDVRSLQRGTEPDETAWCIGEGWWLSTAAPL